MPNFKIEQIALMPADPPKAIELLKALGAHEWVQDIVRASGMISGLVSGSNCAQLLFNYDLSVGGRLEFEVLNYLEGPHWLILNQKPLVSHLGMHITEEELPAYAEVFRRFDIPIVQEVETDTHTNPAIKDSRRYRYIIYGARPILGVDLKFIIRKELPKIEPWIAPSIGD